MDLSLLIAETNIQKYIFDEITKEILNSFYADLLYGKLGDDNIVMRNKYRSGELKICPKHLKSEDYQLIKDIFYDRFLGYDFTPNFGINRTQIDSPIIFELHIVVDYDKFTSTFKYKKVLRVCDFAMRCMALQNMYCVVNIMYFRSVLSKNFDDLNLFLFECLIYSRKARDAGVFPVYVTDSFADGVSYFQRKVVSNPDVVYFLFFISVSYFCIHLLTNKSQTFF